MRRTLGPFAVIVLLAAVVAGCGNSPAQTGTSAAESTHGKAVRFAECMRNSGVSGFPDPDASGRLTIDAVANGSGVDTGSALFNQALATCKHLEPAGFTGHERSSLEQAGALRFAQCIRDHGVRDFPDPGKGQPLIDTRRIPSTATPGGLAILNAAMRKCSAAAAEAGVRGQ